MSRVSVEFGASIGELKSAVDEVNSSLDSIKGHAESAASGFAALAEIAGIALSFEGLKTGFDQLAAFADQIQNAQSKVGGSLESITTLSGVAAMAGVSFQSLTQGVASANLQVQKSASDAYGPAAQGLKALGLSASSLAGLPLDQWFAKVSDAVSRFNPSITLTSNVQQAFGRGFADLMPLLIQGSEGFEELRTAVTKAQEGLSATLPGISETEAKLTLLGLRSRAFAAEIFSVLKPAIDAAIDAFSNLTASITVDSIRDAANAIANYLIDLAASVARFFVEAGVQVDIFKGKLDKLRPSLSLDFGSIDGFAEKTLEIMARASGNYDRMKDTFSKPISLNFGSVGGGEAKADDPTAKLPEQLQAIQDAAQRAHNAVNSVIPTSGGWQAAAQDMTRLNTEVLTAADSFTKLNAVAANNGAKNQMSARASEIEEEIAAEKSKLERIKAIFTEEANDGKITQQQKALYTEQAIDQAFQAEMSFIAQKEKLYAGDAAKYAEVEKEKAKLTATYQQDMLKTVEASQKQMVTTITSGLQTLTGAFNSQLKGLLAGTTSWAQAAKSIASDLFMKLIEMVEQWAVEHAATMIADSVLQKTQAASDVATQAAAEAAKTQATVTGAAARATAETTGSSAGLLAQIGNTLAVISADAAKTFAGVFAFLSPVMGPAAAGPATASAATVQASAAAAAVPGLAIGTNLVLSEGLAYLHSGESVQPASVAGGGYSGGGGGGQIVIAPQLSAFNTTGLQAMINQMMPQFARSLRSYQSLNPSTA